ncbi:putative SANT/Myb domain, Homeobox-like domain superfamily protein [Helianthus annuus]|nr:putative SANT/Myb domain, Homeobox-like domain superfamily protein [Helianthus annuus]
MVQKRQLAEEAYDVSSKHLKLENSCQLVSCLEFPSKDVPLKPCSSAKGGHFPIEIPENNRQFESGLITDKPTRLVPTDDAYSCLLRFPPLKEVPVGPEYQAHIPECCGYDTNNDDKFLGSCVIPMPESYSTVSTDFAVGKGRNDCFCEDRGSLRCVRQHITEARENLRLNIGHERFSALGFDSMGDAVACEWTEEDERLFHEIVYSNPVSLGKNFWEKLEETFPSRTNHEIVSYYFNVFVLQRRAEQNRFDPINADSDDDELQVTDSSEEDDDDSCLDESQKPPGFSIKNPVFDHDDDTRFIFDDSKVWDVDYFSFPRSKADFLPTGSMIEEVFGVESWDSEVTDNE